jgi:uncharacterized protein YeaO (DUF488 family)
MRKEALVVNAWLKEVAPSTELRQWFGHRVERWDGFRRRYQKELIANPGAWEPILNAAERGTVSLLYSAHDALHNGAVVLRDFLEKRQAGRRTRRKRKESRLTSTMTRAKKPPVPGRTGSGSRRRSQ